MQYVLFFLKTIKKYSRLPSAAVVVGALGVKQHAHGHSLQSKDGKITQKVANCLLSGPQNHCDCCEFPNNRCPIALEKGAGISDVYSGKPCSFSYKMGVCTF